MVKVMEIVEAVKVGGQMSVDGEALQSGGYLLNHSVHPRRLSIIRHEGGGGR